MASTQDYIYSKLSAYPGSVNDKLMAWLKAEGATGGSLMDLWMDYLSAYSGTLGERMVAWLKAQGASGSSLRDLYNDYWVNIHV